MRTFVKVFQRPPALKEDLRLFKRTIGFSLMQALALLLLPIFISCSESTELDEVQKQKYAKEGAMIVSEARGFLNTQLYQFLTSGDVKSAIIGACRLSVITSVDSLAEVRNVEIKRVAKQARNENNKPSGFELAELSKYQELVKDSANSKVIKNGNKIHFLSPIYMNGTCLRCHGEQGKNLDEEAHELTQSLYPNDRAIGYKDGDFSGLWSVTFMDEY